MVRAANFQRLGLQPNTTEPVSLEYGEWLPDLPEVDNPGAVEALNVLPSENCYVPFLSHAPSGSDLPAACKGASQVLNKDGVPFVYAGTTTNIYRSSGGAFSSQYTAPLTLSEDRYWQFIEFGNSVVALQSQIAPVVADVGGAPFSPLGGSPPIAQCGARVGNFLVLGNLDNEPAPDAARQPSRIRWSGFNNIEAPWVTDFATQADFNDMPSEGGAVTAITGRENGTVFQERSISRMTYAGLPTVFDIETVEENRGAIATGAVADIGAFVFFIAEDGFHVWNGTNSSPLGDNKVNRYFFKRLNFTVRNRIVSAVDLTNKCVIWAFPAGNSTMLEEMIIYSYKENRFSHSDKGMEYIFAGYTPDVLLDSLTGNLDTDYPISFDDDIFKGRRSYLSGFDMAHRLGFFNGAPMAATIDTSEYTGPGGTRVFANSARPIIDVSSPVATIQPYYRDQLRGGALVPGIEASQEITGECPVLVDGRYVRFRTRVPAGADWQQARGIELWRKVTGRV